MTAYADKSDTDLAKELAEKREELRAFRFGASGSKARDPHTASRLRKEIARILTELSARNKNKTHA